ncbi:MAG: flagellar filament capping protein FliD [Peptococcaceae bacterium]|nr:flagellar filament capping protein FliD [Peptococcaceae bacterium]
MSTPIEYIRPSLSGISGYDFSGITQVMVNNYSLPLNQLNASQKALEAKKDAWRDINTRMSALENTLDKLRDSNLWRATKATSSNENALKVAGAPGAMEGTYMIKVVQAALAQTVASDAQSVAAAQDSLGLGAGTISIKIDNPNLPVGQREVDIDISSGASLQDIAQAINDAKAGVDASVIKTGDGFRLALINKATGEENAAQFSDKSGNVLQSLGVIDGGGNAKNVTQAAKDAVISINGLDNITSSTNTFSDAIKGVTLNLTGDSVGSIVTVKVEADYSEAQQAVQAFVDQYNSVVAFLNDKTHFDADTKVKGDLFGDPLVDSLRSRLRDMISKDFGVGGDSQFTNLKQIGIQTSSDNFGKDGRLVFDTAVFTKAMAEDPESVKNFLGGGSGAMATKGMANVFKDFVHDYVMSDGRLSKTLKSYDSQLADIKKRIDDFNVRIENYAEMIKLKFARLEALLADLDSQRESMTMQMSQLSGLSKQS